MGSISVGVNVGKRMTASRVCKFIQLYVRLKESDDLGYCKCCSCGRVVPWEKLHGGHFQPKGRNYNAVAFDERNVHGQCDTCNTYMNGNPAGYSKFMYENYTQEDLDEIQALSYKYLEKEEMLEVGRKYKALCKVLAKEKMFKVNVPS